MCWTHAYRKIADFINLAEFVTQFDAAMSGLQVDCGHLIVNQVLRFFCLFFLYIFNYVPVIPGLRAGVKVFFGDIIVTVFIKNEKAVSEKLAWILGKEVLLRRWSQSQNMLGHYKNAEERLTVI
jgi:hypothetical protein